MCEIKKKEREKERKKEKLKAYYARLKISSNRTPRTFAHPLNNSSYADVRMCNKDVLIQK